MESAGVVSEGRVEQFSWSAPPVSRCAIYIYIYIYICVCVCVCVCLNCFTVLPIFYVSEALDTHPRTPSAHHGQPQASPTDNPKGLHWKSPTGTTDTPKDSD